MAVLRRVAMTRGALPVRPSRDSRATSSLRIDQQPATTSALVTKWVKPTNINCRETGLRSLVTNNCRHSRTKSEVSPKITFYGRLHVIACRARLDVPREVVWFLAKLPAVERQRRGTPRGSRALTCFWQAVLGLRWFRDRTAADAPARDHGISRATAYRYLDEVVIVLAEQAPDLREALERAEDKGFSHVILDGKIIPCDRCKEPAVSVRGEVIDLWYSGKAHAHGGNVQAVLAPDGFPLWVSQVEPGSVHDITAARAHALPALYPAAAAGLPALADPGYEGAGIGILIPVKQPPGSRELDVNTRTRNALQRSLRCLGETRVRAAHRPVAHPSPHHRQPQQNRRHRPRGARPHPFRARLHHMNFVEITSIWPSPPKRKPACRFLEETHNRDTTDIR